MKEHNLKTHPEYFRDVIRGFKSFEVRKNDRDFQLGDRLLLKEFEPKSKSYTGKEFLFKITYILDGGGFGIKKGFCVMSIIPIKRSRGMVVYTKTEIIDK